MVTKEAVEKINGMAEADLKKVITPEGFIASDKDQKFGVFFGRDDLIASLFTLKTLELHPDRPELLIPVRDGLVTLARTQGRVLDPWRDETPGKIIHEWRHELIPENQKRLAELKATGWPVEGEPGRYYMRYYGSVDSTPLFVWIGSDYIRLTQDYQFFNWLDPHLRSAIDWMEGPGDPDGDGYIEYSAENRNALLNQGWKDSFDSIEIAPGRRPKEPIALVEVQGYAYAAYLAAAELYRLMGDIEYSKRLYQKAGMLKVKLNREFWMEDESFFAYALDGDKRQVREKTSNVGHLLMTGIIDKDKTLKAVAGLMQPDMLTPWGIRTLSSLSANFSDREPSAYHLGGGVWPHDNGIIYLGFKKAGFYYEAGVIRDAVLGAQYYLDQKYELHNPELYLVDRHNNLRPYDTACHPQGWGASVNRTWTDPLEISQLVAAGR